MVHCKRKSVLEEQAELASVKVGDWVDVEADYSPGLCSDGGYGCVIGLHTQATVGAPLGVTITAVDVHFLMYSRKERGIDLSRVVVVPMPFKGPKVVLRQRPDKVSTSQAALKPPPVKSSMEWLKYGLSTRRHEKPGWLKDALVENNILPADDKVALWNRVLLDYQCQLSCLEGMQHVLGSEYKDPREYTGIRDKNSGGKYVSTKKTSQQGIPKNVFTIPYLMWAYDVKKPTFKRRLKESKQGIIEVAPKKHTDTSVINCRVLARERFNAKYFYTHEKAITSRDVDPMATTQAQYRPEWLRYKYRVGYWGKEFDKLIETQQDVSAYERMARQHDERQPFIQDEIMDALIHSNNCTSYRALSKHTNGWCSPATIEVWLKSHPTYNIYAKNIKPGLTAQNRLKQVAFSKHVHNRWGISIETRKILWIHSDEKWFHALVPRGNAKACAELGLERQTYSAYHKSHIGKVMAHCTVGYCFGSNVEDAGDGYLIGLHRCANFKVPLRDVRYSSKDPVTNRISFVGNPIKYPKGIPYLVDCNVTGSNPGTATVPCFPLKLLWEHSLLPAIQAMVAPGGPCEGAQVVYQEDNAGPHTEAGYTQWLRDTFDALGWKLELQAPQGTCPSLLSLYYPLH